MQPGETAAAGAAQDYQDEHDEKRNCYDNDGKCHIFSYYYREKGRIFPYQSWVLPDVRLMKQTRFLLEMALCFFTFFLPGYLSQGMEPSSGPVSTSIMLQSIVLGIPQFLLMVYIASLSRETPLAGWGFSEFRAADSLRVALVLIGCFVIFTPFAVLVLSLPSDVARYLSSGFRWRLASASQIPLAVVFGLAAGYREEFFFRSYMLRRLEQMGSPLPLSVAASTLLFSAGHYYQGPLGLATSAALGVLFASVYVRRRSLHVIAIAHGLYNASVLCLSLLRVSPLSSSP